MKYALPIFLSALCAACVSPEKAGPYPRGFIIGSHMHYWNPKVARVLFGADAPTPTEKHPEPYVWPQPYPLPK